MKKPILKKLITCLADNKIQTNPEQIKQLNALDTNRLKHLNEMVKQCQFLQVLNSMSFGCLLKYLPTNEHQAATLVRMLYNSKLLHHLDVFCLILQGFPPSFKDFKNLHIAICVLKKENCLEEYQPCLMRDPTFAKVIVTQHKKYKQHHTGEQFSEVLNQLINRQQQRKIAFLSGFFTRADGSSLLEEQSSLNVLRQSEIFDPNVLSTLFSLFPTIEPEEKAREEASSCTIS